MSKKTLLFCTTALLLLGVRISSANYNIEYSIGGNATAFPATSKGSLIVDPAGDGFDFVQTPSILLGKSDSKAGEKWGNNDIVVFSGLTTEEFPGVGRGFNIPSTRVSTDKWKEGDKVALVWFPEGTSTNESLYSYYTSDSVESQSGTIPLRTPKNGATDSTIALGVSPRGGTIGGTTSGGVVGPSGGGGSSQVQKSKKGGSKGKKSPIKKSVSKKKSDGKKSGGKKKSEGKKKDQKKKKAKSR